MRTFTTLIPIPVLITGAGSCLSAYQSKQLLDYKTRAGDSRGRYKKTSRLSEPELADLAAHYATLPAERVPEDDDG